MAGSAVDYLVMTLGNFLLEEASLIGGLHSNLDDIKLELQSIQSFLKDSDQKKVSNEGVRTWVGQVREVAYDVEDIIDEFMYRTTKNFGTQGVIYKTICFPRCCFYTHQIATQLQQIKLKIADIYARGMRYGFVEEASSSRGNDASENKKSVPQSVHFVPDKDIVGIDENKSCLIRWLKDKEPQRMVLSVVGMGGLGKTTLVTKAYNSEELKDCFDCRACITISQSYKIMEILRSLIKELYKSNEAPVPHNTGQMSYGDLVSTLITYLQPSSSKPKRAFWNRADKLCPPELHSYARSLVRKCEGLPLAIVSIGGLMSLKEKTTLEWKKEIMTPRKRRIIAFLALLLLKKREMYISKEPCRTSILSGHVFVQGILEANRRVCLELLRMEKHVFLRLCVVLREKMLLEDNRYVTVEEQVAIFLMTIGQNHRNRILQDRFQHSGETIHRHFHAVLVAMIHLSMDIIKPPSYDQTPKEIFHNPRFYPYLKDCVGAIDGTLVNAVIPIENQVPYRGRKGECQQNILAACSFDMLFTFIIAGWEGTAHDSCILLDTIYKPHLNFPNAPQDFRAGGRPRDRKEHFNYVHSSLRNVIERSFGVLKARFPILKRMPPYSFPVQRSIVVAAMTVHNFIRKEAIADALFIQYENEDISLEASNNDYNGISDTDAVVDIAEQMEMSEVRNAIADALFQS